MTDALIVLILASNLVGWGLATYWLHRYMQYKKHVMTAMYGTPKSDLMKQVADLKGYPIIDFKIQGCKTGRVSMTGDR